MRTEQFQDLSVARLFAARKWALMFAVALLVIVLIGGRNIYAVTVQLVLMGALVISTVVTWFHIYRITQCLHGTGYALGHLAIAVVLTPVFLTGLILVPLLVRGDVQRLT